VYRDIRGGDDNPHPFHVTKTGTFQSSRQDRAHLLCAECELRFSKNGENWFFRHNLKTDGTFKLLDKLRAGPASVWEAGHETMLYEADRFPDIDAAALVYFATSVFWRGSIHDWNGNGRPPVNLHGYADQFRRYLLGEKGFPESASLVALVRPSTVVDKVIYAPHGGSRGSRSLYEFPMPGFSFLLHIGPRLTVKQRQYCLVRGLGRPLVVTTVPDEHIFKTARRAMGFHD